MLKFRVEGQKLTWENPDEVVVAGTKKYLECYFEFDGDAWSGFEYIEAFFKNGRDKPIRMLLSANRIWKENGLCLTAGDWSVYLCATTYNAEKEEIERQITSSSVSIRVLAHGVFEDAQNSFESPEIANQYIAAMQIYEEAREKAEDERVEAENARNVFEEYNPDKTYVKGNKVSYEGSSYVLTADEALGTNPTDKGSWLCIAEKGDKGEQGVQGIKGEKGADGKDGKDGTLWIPFKFDVDIKKGEKKRAEFDFTRNIFKFGDKTYDDLDKNDFPNIYEWAVGDFLVSNNGNVLLITRFERINSEMLNFDAECILEAETIVVDESYNPTSSNPISGRAISEVFAAMDIYKANADLSNVSDEDFRTKAEAAGIGGDAGLAGEGCVMKFMHEVSALPETANDGEVYSLSPWTNVGEFFDASGTVITEHTIYFGGWSSIANFLYDDVQRYYGCTYKFIIGNREFIFKECGVSSAGPDGFEMSVNCTEQDVNYTIPYNSTVEVYRTDGEPKGNDSYVRFNGKWIKL